LERLFKTELSMSPAQFALQLRLSRAHELLKQSRNPIADIAIQCGFVNQSHFSRSFKDSYGSAPSDIRRAN
jgi:transcriptional regulator GlxA family with amidase domain